jgi:hypothetical protein
MSTLERRLGKLERQATKSDYARLPEISDDDLQAFLDGIISTDALRVLVSKADGFSLPGAQARARRIDEMDDHELQAHVYAGFRLALRERENTALQREDA